MKDRKHFRTDHRGFSMVEAIIVVAVIGILAAATVSLIGHVRYANTKKTMEEIGSMLSKQQVNSMSKADRQILYIYKVGEDYYMRSLTAAQIDGAGGSADALLDTSGMKIANRSVEIYGSFGGAETAVSGNTDDTCIKVAFNRSGLYDSSRTNVDQIIVKGGSNHTIVLLQNTGKYLVD